MVCQIWAGRQWQAMKVGIKGQHNVEMPSVHGCLLYFLYKNIAFGARPAP